MQPEMGDARVGLPQSIELVDNVGLIEVVKGKLISQRDPLADPAADKLTAVLAELNQIFSVAEWGLNQYLALFFYEGQDPRERNHERTKLLQLEAGTLEQGSGATQPQGGTIYRQMKDARTRCNKISNIYRRFLEPWFNRVLNDPENALMRELFYNIGTADIDFSVEIDNLADWLSQQARETLDLVDDGKIQEANQRIRQARLDTRPQRDAIRAAMNKLSALQAEFTDAAGAV